MSGFQSRPPASIKRTRVAGSSVSRLAKTQPAEPAPMMMKSACIAPLPLGGPVKQGRANDRAQFNATEEPRQRVAGRSARVVRARSVAGASKELGPRGAALVL